MPKKGKKIHVQFKGRFQIEKHQNTSDIAFRLLEKCMRKKHLTKTFLRLNEDRFHVGSRTGLVQLRRKVFAFMSILRFFVFKSDQKAVIFVTELNQFLYMSLVKFDNELEMKEVLDTVQEFIGNSTNVVGYVNNVFQDDNIDGKDEVDGEFILESSDEEDGEEDDKVYQIDDFLENATPFIENTFEDDFTFEGGFFENNGWKIDNIFNSPFDDLLIDFNVGEPEKGQNYQVCGGSMYMYSRSFEVQNTFGTCEVE